MGASTALDELGGSAVAAFYDTKPDSYFSGARVDFVEALPADPKAAILEIGCGNGTTGALALSAAKCATYCGVELSPRAAGGARKRLTEVVVGNIEEIALDWPAATFDALILSEVLEHLVDPWQVMKRLAPLVRPGGLVLVSSPNIAHYSIVLQLLAGRWDLTDRGAMDRTHLRWFTPRTYADLINTSGFKVDTIRPMVPFSPHVRCLTRLFAGSIDHLFMRQIVIHGRKT